MVDSGLGGRAGSVPEERAPLGFKRLTATNWLEPTDFMRVFGWYSPETGKIGAMTSEDWARRILAPTLSPQIPVEIERLFEVARGTMLYGYFFYPLYTLGMEQLYRVLEAAVTRRCHDLGAPTRVKTEGGKKRRVDYEWRINWLMDHGVLSREPATELVKWVALRQLRNYASHPQDQTISMPGAAVFTTHDIASRINHLFVVKPDTD